MCVQHLAALLRENILHIPVLVGHFTEFHSMVGMRREKSCLKLTMLVWIVMGMPFLATSPA